MGETNKDKKKPKICILALVVFLIPLLYIIASFCMIYTNQDISVPFRFFLMLCGIVVMFYLIVVPISFILGFIAIIRIALSKRLLKGYAFAVLGILMSIWAFVSSAQAFICPRMHTLKWICQSNMKQLGKTIQQYCQAHNGQYPEPNEWCDSLFEFWKSQNPEKIKNIPNSEEYTTAEFDRLLLGKAGFLCPSHIYCEDGRYDIIQSSYAINPLCRPDSPPDTVLLFETLEGWDKFGGSESMSFNHEIYSILPFRWGEGCNVLFNDGHVELIDSRNIEMLKWKDKKAR